MISEKEIRAVCDYYIKHPFRVETRTYSKTEKRYRATEEFFKKESQARKRYDRLMELHSPEWDISLSKFMVIGWSVMESNRQLHHLWRFDTYGIKSNVFNLDKVREFVEAEK